MTVITATKRNFNHNEIVKRLRIKKDVSNDVYYILVDMPKQKQTNVPIMDEDGESVKTFKTRDLAVDYALCQVNDLINIGLADKYTAWYLDSKRTATEGR